MKLTKTQLIRGGIALCGVIALVGKQYLDHQGLDLQAILNSTSFSDLLETFGVGAILSQYIPRAGDTAPHKVEQKVDAKVAEIMRSTVPPGVQ